MDCEYCGTDIGAEKVCHRCGAKKTTTESSYKLSPFFFHGYMIWPEVIGDLHKYHIWSGELLIGNFVITREMYYAYQDKFGVGVCIDTLIDKLLRIAIGESEKEYIERECHGRKFMFEITEIKTKEYLDALESIN